MKNIPPVPGRAADRGSETPAVGGSRQARRLRVSWGQLGAELLLFMFFFCKQNNFWWPTKRELKSSQSSIQRRFEGTFNESKIESDTIDLSETPQIPTRMSLGPLVTGGRDLDAGMVAKVARHFISNVKIQISSSADIRSIWALP